MAILLITVTTTALVGLQKISNGFVDYQVSAADTQLTNEVTVVMQSMRLEIGSFLTTHDDKFAHRYNVLRLALEERLSHEAVVAR